MRLDGGDFALEELGGMGFADEVHQHARHGHKNGHKVESPAPVLCVRHCSTHMWNQWGKKIPVERDGNIARINGPENETEIRHQCPGKEGPHETFGAEEIFNAMTGRDGWDGGDKTGDEAANEDAGDVGSRGHWEAEDAVEERGGDVQRPASNFVGIWGQQQRTQRLTEQVPGLQSAVCFYQSHDLPIMFPTYIVVNATSPTSLLWPRTPRP